MYCGTTLKIASHELAWIGIELELFDVKLFLLGSRVTERQATNLAASHDWMRLRMRLK